MSGRPLLSWKVTISSFVHDGGIQNDALLGLVLAERNSDQITRRTPARRQALSQLSAEHAGEMLEPLGLDSSRPSTPDPEP